MANDVVQRDLVQRDIEYIREAIDEIKGKLEKNYVTNDQFVPVARIAYGIVALMGVALVGAVMKMVLK